MRYELKGISFFLLFVAIFITSIIIIAPLRQAFEYNPDEGINLMKSWLFLKGFPLYSQVWNDQPPLATVILAYWLKFFGPSVYHSRILILIFSAVFLWAFYQIIKISFGCLCASIAVAFLLLSAAYLRLSISIMIGIPALTFAMLSVYFATIYKKLKLIYFLPPSGIFMALSLQTKLFSVFLTPLIILDIALSERIDLKNKTQKSKTIFHIFLWISSFLVVYLSIAAIFFHLDFILLIQQLFQTHIVKSAFTKPYYGFSVMLGMIFLDYDIVLLALVAAFLIIRCKKWGLLFPVLWLILAFLLLINHRPIWPHHYLLMSVPCSWLAAICLCEFFHANTLIWPAGGKGMGIFLRWLTAGIVILTIIAFPFKLERAYRNLWGTTTNGERDVNRLISKHRKNTHWIITDRPIFAFYADIPMPPELAVITEKRILTQNLKPSYFISILDKYRPEQIILARFDNYDRRVISYIEQKYFKSYSVKLYNYVWCLPYVWFTNHDRFYKFLFLREGYFCQPPKTEVSIYLTKDILKP